VRPCFEREKREHADIRHVAFLHSNHKWAPKQ
jgi:hypothetical protein